jgi:predicted phage terminase large subunit-like protein
VTRNEAVNFLLTKPYKLGHMLGFTKLTELHNGWIIDMVRGTEDRTLQAHRSSYKTTCVSIALSLIVVLMPRLRTMFMRKTDSDIKEVIRQVRKILESQQMRYFVQTIYGVQLQLITATANELSTNLTNDPRGTAQLTGLGTGGSITGKHYDRIFTDDIVNVQDRVSKAERDRTKIIYQELRNIINRGGRIYNTGTPWHADDAFTLMPEPEKYDCYSTGLIDADMLESIRNSMTASLFAANYELRHIASEDVIFANPQTDGDPAMVEQGDCHIDAAYGGEDYTAFTICNKVDGKYYILGKLWRKHVDDCTDAIIQLRIQHNAGKIYCENNGDKGYLGKELRRKNERTVIYHEDMNKFLKITSYLKAAWKDVVFVVGTDRDYINQVCDYNENAEHDDAPDSLASIIRKKYYKKSASDQESSGNYVW